MTTEWAVLFLLPLVPLRSLRVISNLGLDEYYFVYSSKKYLVVEQLPLNRGQVASVYCFVGSILVSVGLFLFLAFKLGISWEKHTGPLIFLTACIGLIPAFIARSRWRQAKQDVVVTKEAFLETLNRLGITRGEPPSANQAPERDTVDEVPPPRRHSPSEGYYDY